MPFIYIFPRKKSVVSTLALGKLCELYTSQFEYPEHRHCFTWLQSCCFCICCKGSEVQPAEFEFNLKKNIWRMRVIDLITLPCTMCLFWVFFSACLHFSTFQILYHDAARFSSVGTLFNFEMCKSSALYLCFSNTAFVCLFFLQNNLVWDDYGKSVCIDGYFCLFLVYKCSVIYMWVIGWNSKWLWNSVSPPKHAHKKLQYSSERIICLNRVLRDKRKNSALCG